MRIVGPAFQLWDVRNVEAHVARAVQAGLDARGAHLSSAQHDRCFQFCLLWCWRVSGLTRDGGDGKDESTWRWEYEIAGFLRPAGMYEPYRPFKLPRFHTPEAAELALASFRETEPVAFGQVRRVRPGGVYEKSHGLAFATWTYRLIVNHRIDDWYRSDPEFGDTRYASNRRVEVSLEELATRHREDGEHADELLPAPIGRLEVLDALNAHHYQDAGEEVLTRAAFGFRG